MTILGIETSCDDTSIALVEKGYKILWEKRISQLKAHNQFGGVVPEIAARRHLPNLFTLLRKIPLNYLKTPKLKIAVTRGPGLLGSLIVGVITAKTLGYIWEKRVLGIDHLEAHLYSLSLNQPKIWDKLPILFLTLSGGHTALVLMRDIGNYKVLGKTLDDAAGEAFDKVAFLLGLNYPGGPEIDKLARKGKADKINFPRAMCGEKNFHFSFSGLKTSVLRYLEKTSPSQITKSDVAASFQEAVVDICLQKLAWAEEDYPEASLAIVGGVAANSRLRTKSKERWGEKINFVEPQWGSDNGAMIASAAYYLSFKKQSLRPQVNLHKKW